MNHSLSNLTLYSNPRKPHHAHGVREFLKVAETFPKMVFKNVDVVNNPWHIQAYALGVLVDFWPCANKMCVMGEKSVCGAEEMTAKLADIYARGPEPEFDPIDAKDKF